MSLKNKVSLSTKKTNLKDRTMTNKANGLIRVDVPTDCNGLTPRDMKTIEFIEHCESTLNNVFSGYVCDYPDTDIIEHLHLARQNAGTDIYSSDIQDLIDTVMMYRDIEYLVKKIKGKECLI